MNTIGQNFPPADPAETIQYGYDFQSQVLPGEVIESTAWSIALVRGVDADPGEHKVGPDVIYGYTCKQMFDWSIGATLVGNVYSIRCEATTDQGNVYVAQANTEIVTIRTAPIQVGSYVQRQRVKVAFGAGTCNIISVDVNAAFPFIVSAQRDPADLTSGLVEIDWRYVPEGIESIKVTATTDCGVSVVLIPFERPDEVQPPPPPPPPPLTFDEAAVRFFEAGPGGTDIITGWPAGDNIQSRGRRGAEVLPMVGPVSLDEVFPATTVSTFYVQAVPDVYKQLSPAEGPTVPSSVTVVLNTDDVIRARNGFELRLVSSDTWVSELRTARPGSTSFLRKLYYGATSDGHLTTVQSGVVTQTATFTVTPPLAPLDLWVRRIGDAGSGTLVPVPFNSRSVRLTSGGWQLGYRGAPLSVVENALGWTTKWKLGTASNSLTGGEPNALSISTKALGGAQFASGVFVLPEQVDWSWWDRASATHYSYALFFGPHTFEHAGAGLAVTATVSPYTTYSMGQSYVVQIPQGDPGVKTIFNTAGGQYSVPDTTTPIMTLTSVLSVNADANPLSAPAVASDWNQNLDHTVVCESRLRPYQSAQWWGGSSTLALRWQAPQIGASADPLTPTQLQALTAPGEILLAVQRWVPNYNTNSGQDAPIGSYVRTVTWTDKPTFTVSGSPPGVGSNTYGLAVSNIGSGVPWETEYWPATGSGEQGTPSIIYYGPGSGPTGVSLLGFCFGTFNIPRDERPSCAILTVAVPLGWGAVPEATG